MEYALLGAEHTIWTPCLPAVFFSLRATPWMCSFELTVHVAQCLLICEMVSCICLHKLILEHLDIRNLVATISLFENLSLLDGDTTCLLEI